MKIIILYAGLGGESEKWDDVNNDITHVEIDSKIARVLQERKLNRNVIVGDAYAYLLKHFKEFDFVWSSPPCQKNSRMIISGRNRTPSYPDLTLYEQFIFLEQYFEGGFVVENVKPYYPLLIKPSFISGRHLFWANFDITSFEVKQPKDFINLGALAGAEKLKTWLGIDYEGTLYYNNNHCPAQVLRNCVHPDLGEHIFNCYRKKILP